MNTTAAALHAEQEHHAPPRGPRRWFYSTNHKDIGTLYLIFAGIMLFIGGASAMIIRAELFMPGLQLVDPDLYNNLITNHGLIMIFGAVMPAAAGMANWMIPMMIGSPDMALPRMNNLSFWLLPAGATMLMLSFVVPLLGGGTQINTGWTLYPPLSIQVGPAMDFLIFGLHLMGISSILASINIIVTLLNMRAPGMTLMKMPVFCWTWLVTAFLLILVMPVLAGALTMLIFDRHFGTSFFSAAGGGDPVLFQHLFWFFGHPEVYILLLPSFGILAHVIPTFTRKPLFGYKVVVGSLIGIACLGMVVWAHHQYTIGMSLAAVQYFMVGTILISIPVGLIVFSFIATMWRGSMTFETPMLFAVAIILTFTFGGLSGIMLAVVPADMQYHDSMFVVAHFHYVLLPGAVFGLLAGVFYWLPKWTGRMYNERLAKLFFWSNIIGFNLTFFPQHFLGLAGMPRRIADYNLIFTEFNVVSSVGAALFGASFLLFAYVVIQTVVAGPRVSRDPVWEGARGLEWELPSPPPFHSWPKAPVLT